MARMWWLLLALVMATVHPFAATCSAQPLAQGCWYDCPGTGLEGDAGFIAIGSTPDVFVHFYESQIVRFDGVGNCGPSWRARSGPTTPPPIFFSGCGVDPSGNFLAVERTYNLVRTWSRDGDSLRVWGGFGSGSGRFQVPFGLAVGANGVVYVGDNQLSTVQRFDGQGNFLGEWSAFGSVVSLAVDDSGFVYVGLQSQVGKYTSNGTLIKMWGSPGTEPGQFLHVGTMACDHLGNLYVNDTQRDVIQAFTTSGVYQYQWDAPSAGGLACDSANNLYVTFISPDSRVCKYGPGPLPASPSTWGRVKTLYR